MTNLGQGDNKKITRHGKVGFEAGLVESIHNVRLQTFLSFFFFLFVSQFSFMKQANNKQSLKNTFKVLKDMKKCAYHSSEKDYKAPKLYLLGKRDLNEHNERIGGSV